MSAPELEAAGGSGMTDYFEECAEGFERMGQPETAAALRAEGVAFRAKHGLPPVADASRRAGERDAATPAVIDDLHNRAAEMLCLFASAHECRERLAEHYIESALDLAAALRAASAPPPERAARESEPDDDDGTQEALEILCRAFHNGADVVYPEWLAWYDRSQWLTWSRALGAFIYRKLNPEGAAPPRADGRAETDTVALLYGLQLAMDAEYNDAQRNGCDGEGAWRCAMEAGREFIAALRVPPATSEATEAIRAEAFEQAAQWCVERADRMRERAKRLADPERLLDAAEWVYGCADTIRHNAEMERAAPPAGPTNEEETR